MDFLQEKAKIFAEAKELDETNPDYVKVKDQFSGQQYPDLHELQPTHRLICGLRDKFRCIDPLDEGIDKFEARKIKIGEVKQLILDKMENNGAMADMFTKDLPKSMYEFFRDKVLRDIT